MKIWAALIISLGLCGCSTVPPQATKAVQIEFIDAATAFDVLWQKSKNLSAEVQLEMFNQSVTPLFPDYYKNKVSADRLNKELKQYPTYRQKYLNSIQNLQIFLPKALKEFKKQFPDIKIPVQVYIVQSFDEMDGGTRTLNGKPHLIFGAESIAKYHANLDFEYKNPFFHHELFHIYHSQFFTDESELVSSLWSEGLAILAAQELNPKASLRELTLDKPERLMQLCHDILPDLKKNIKTRLLRSFPDTYETYFFMTSQHPWIPKRAGYCIGYEIARLARKSKTVSELARLQRTEVEAILKEFLKGATPY